MGLIDFQKTVLFQKLSQPVFKSTGLSRMNTQTYEGLSLPLSGADHVKFSGDRKPLLTPRFQEALVYATELHATQVRKGSDTPYISHLIGVASIVLEHGGNEDEAIAALLHDAVEDQGGAPTLAVIRKRFGDVVADIVDGCTDADVTPKPPWKERKQAYIDHIPHASTSIRLVSAADKLYNARAILEDYLEIGDEVFKRFKPGKEGTLWYYRELVKAFRKAGSETRLIRELDRTVTELESVTAKTPVS